MTDLLFTTALELSGPDSHIVAERFFTDTFHHQSTQKWNVESRQGGGFTCWLGGVAWGVCPVGGACPPLLSTTGMLGDVVLWWGLNESCQSTAFLFNTHTLLIPPQPVQKEMHLSHTNTSILNQHMGQTKCLSGSDEVDAEFILQDGEPMLGGWFIGFNYLKVKNTSAVMTGL